MSFTQQRLWFIDQFEPGSAAYNVSAALRLTGTLDVDAFSRSLQSIVDRHEILRTTFAAKADQPVQIIAPSLALQLPIIDLSGFPPAEREQRALGFAQEEDQTPFDLTKGPLIRAKLLRLATYEHIALLTLHHIISDGWSVKVLVQEMGALYSAFLQNQPLPLAPLEIQFADFAYWQRQWFSGNTLNTQLDYWTSQLRDAPALLTLPTDRPRPPIQTYRGTSLPFKVSASVTAGLHAISSQGQATLFMTLMAAFNVLLSRYSGQFDICVGTPIANRKWAETEALIGFFVNTLVIRTRIDAKAPFTALLQQVRATALEAYSHPDVPFEQLFEVLKPERSLSYAPLFQVMFVLQNTAVGKLSLPELSITALDVDNTSSKFDFLLEAEERNGELNCFFGFNTDLFDRPTIERMARNFTCLLEAIVANPMTPVSDLPIVDSHERKLSLVDWNDTVEIRPVNQTVHQMFERQAATTPEATAVIINDARLCYGQLNSRANRLAHHLRAQGVGPDVFVGICMDRSLDMFVALLGVLKAGGAYVPLEPTYPLARLAYLLDDATPKVILTQSHLLSRLQGTKYTTICLDTHEDIFSEMPDVNPEALASTGNLAYVIYTSGSTGQPKGVMVEHQSLLNLSCVQAAKLRDSSCASVLQFANLNFDMSVEEIFPTLITGAQLIVRPSTMLAPDTDFLNLLEAHNVDALNLPASFWHHWVSLLDNGQSKIPACVRYVAVGGEKVNVEQYNHWARHASDRKGIWVNAYGPTESTVNATCFSAEFGKELTLDEVPIGRPIANTRIYILDDALEPVPVGVTGELYIAGCGLARGYLNRPAMTAERFIADPFSTIPGDRMYKSGDLARYLADGRIEYVGRVDYQVKIRGFRIELGEIEAALSVQANVRDCVVTAREDAPGEKRLVAYVLIQPDTDVANASPLTTENLRSALSRTLPEYMVPAHFVLLERLPLTQNGKIDRHALPAPNIQARNEHYVAPRTATEKVVASIWAEALAIELVSADDNFFALGGHSLLTLKVFHGIRQHFNVMLPLATIFTSPTVSALSQLIDARQIHQSLLVPLNVQREGVPLFLIHPVGGQVLHYQELSDRLGADMPVYGIQAPEVAGLPERFDTLDAMASAYASVVTTKQTDGTYHLAGWSTGGIIALAIGAELTAQGRKVRYVGLLDANPVLPTHSVTEDNLLRHAALTVLAALCRRQFSTDELTSMELSLARHSLNITHLFQDAHSSFALSFLATWTGEPASVELLSFLQKQVNATVNHLRLLVGYRPETTYARLHVIRPLIQNGQDRSDFTFHGPANSAQGEHRTDTLDGDHYSILKPPYVNDLARLMRAAMLETESAHKRIEHPEAPADSNDELLA